MERTRIPDEAGPMPPPIGPGPLTGHPERHRNPSGDRCRQVHRHPSWAAKSVKGSGFIPPPIYGVHRRLVETRIDRWRDSSDAIRSGQGLDAAKRARRDGTELTLT